MPNWFTRLAGGRLRAPDETKAVHKSVTISELTGLGEAHWSARSFTALVQQGFARNPVVYRCVRLVAEAAAMVPLEVDEGGTALGEHPVARLLRRPNPRTSGAELLELVYAHLQTAGNAYLEAAIADGEIKGLYVLRPDRMKVVPGRDGWPAAYDYTAGGQAVRLSLMPAPIPRVLHLTLLDPLDDHYGLAPLAAAQQSIDIHNAAARWNKSLLDNAARPSGALVYSLAQGNLTDAQFRRLKEELELGFAGAANAGRPMVLEGGLDWKTIAMSPKDMDFIEAKHTAAREIALAFGVPPMILGIPGDNTYANLVEANKALWRQTIVPLVRRVADDLATWLAPIHGDDFALRPAFDTIEALGEDQALLWRRVGEASFLSDAEKRRLVGLPPQA